VQLFVNSLNVLLLNVNCQIST